MMHRPRNHLRLVPNDEVVCALSTPGQNTWNAQRFVVDGDYGGTAKSGLFPRLSLWAERYRQRRRWARELPGFTDEMLKDFGLTRQEAHAIAHRPFWKA